MFMTLCHKVTGVRFLTHSVILLNPTNPNLNNDMIKLTGTTRHSCLFQYNKKI